MSKKPEEDRSQLITSYFEDEIKTSYLNYAYSVITARAIPDVRDGFKPVHRRILYAMSELALWHDKPTRKSARVVGDVLGKYHPHGDSSVYMAAVKLAQDFSIRYPMVIGQGNFGSIDDDPPAAMRYTEMKLSRIAEFMLDDLKKDTVDFRPNFDDTLTEPSVLPGKFPNILCNGTSGIAVGFATDIPPHNFREVAAGIAAYIDNPKITVKELMKFIKGPDFPTYGVLTNQQEIRDIYETGHGSVQLAGKMDIEEKGGQKALVVTEIPYRVVKSKLVEEITNLLLDNKNKYSLILRGIKEVRDESSKEGLRIVIVLNRDADEEAIKTVLYKQTSMSVKLKVNIVILVKNQPRILNLRDLIHYYVEHRRDVIIRRTKFDLDKAEKELHIIDGLLIAVANIDEVIAIIKKSKDVPNARENLMKRFGLTEIQATAILDMRLQKLTNLETLKLKERKDELVKLIAELKAILASEKKRDDLIKRELKEMEEVVGDERRTKFGEISTATIEQEELISNEPMLITVSKKGFVIREIGNSLKQSNRGGKGRRGDATDTDRLEADDYIFTTVSGNLKDTILFVTSAGRVYSLKGYEIVGDTEGKITRAHIRNIDRLKEIEAKSETITAVLLVEEFKADCYLIFCTKRGKVAKISLEKFSNINRTGINGIKLASVDAVAGAVMTNGSQYLFFVKRNSKGFRIDEKKFSVYNRGVGGQKGTSVSKTSPETEEVIGIGIADEGKSVVFITSDGRSKKAKPHDFNELVRPGGKGFKLVEIGKERIIADFAICEPGDSLLVTTKQGKRISVSADALAPKLLKVIDLSKDDEVSAVSTIKAVEE